MKKHLNLHIISAFLCMVVFIAVLLFGGVGVTYAATSNYSNVLDDLRKDENFDFNDYPNVDNDYSLQVIQIAESTDGELFLYVYQPSALTKPLTATMINMALSEEIDGTALFNLTLLSREGVLQKYRVDGVRVSSDEVRYYNISTIYRDYDDSIDSGSSDESILTGKSFNVGKLFKAKTENGRVSYFCEGTEIIEIINPFFGFVSYYNGFELFPSRCDSHYVAFSTNKQIDYLEEATLSYVTYNVTSIDGLAKKTNRKEFPTFKVSCEETGETSASGWFVKKYTWNRIVTVYDFINNPDDSISSDFRNELENRQWVIRFLETERTESNSGHVNRLNYTSVEEVTILRLKFVSGGDAYNLGAVSDIGYSAGVRSNGDKSLLDQFCEWLESVTGVPALVWKIIICALPFIIILPILSAIFPVVGQVLIWILKAILWLICLPFKGIAALVHKIRGD